MHYNYNFSLIHYDGIITVNLFLMNTNTGIGYHFSYIWNLFYFFMDVYPGSSISMNYYQ